MLINLQNVVWYISKKNIDFVLICQLEKQTKNMQSLTNRQFFLGKHAKKYLMPVLFTGPQSPQAGLLKPRPGDAAKQPLLVGDITS